MSTLKQQLVEQRLAFGEPAVDRSEKLACLIPLALIALRVRLDQRNNSVDRRSSSRVSLHISIRAVDCPRLHREPQLEARAISRATVVYRLWPPTHETQATLGS